MSTSIFAFVLCVSLTAQVEINPEVLMFETDGSDFKIEPEVINNTEFNTNIYWMFEKGENFPDAWSVIICDDTLCYSPNTFKSSGLLPNLMNAGYSFKFKMTVQANGVAGSSYGILHLYDDNNCSNEVATSMPPTTSVNTDAIDHYVVYPNPASEIFRIKNDQHVKSIEILNSSGQVQIKEIHQKGQVHSISHLSNGIFFLKLKDGNGEILKIEYLTKN